MPVMVYLKNKPKKLMKLMLKNHQCCPLCEIFLLKHKRRSMKFLSPIFKNIQKIDIKLQKTINPISKKPHKPKEKLRANCRQIKSLRPPHSHRQWLINNNNKHVFFPNVFQSKTFLTCRMI